MSHDLNAPALGAASWPLAEKRHSEMQHSPPLSRTRKFCRSSPCWVTAIAAIGYVLLRSLPFCGNGRILIRQKVNQSDLAAMAAVARENVSRVLKEWTEHGMVSRLAGYYCLEKKDAIQSEAEPTG